MRKISSRTLIVLLFLAASLALFSLLVLSATHDAKTARDSALSISTEEVAKKVDEHEKWLAAGNCEPDGVTGSADIGGHGFQMFVVETEFQPLFLPRRNLAGMDFSKRDLRCANFLASVLDGASFFGADLRGVILTHASLVGANLDGSDLRGTVLHSTDLKDSVFQPSFNPEPGKIAASINLDHIVFSDDRRAIYKLKLAFGSGGYVASEKEVIAALNRNKVPRSDFDNQSSIVLDEFAYIFREVAFGITSAYGANAFLPLLWIYVLFIAFSAIYVIGLSSKSKSGIYLSFPRKVSNTLLPDTIESKLHRVPIYKRIELAMAFSLRSALRLGFQNFDFGRWLRMLQHREYDIVAIGWMRPVSAIQSLLSVYLIALSILSAFGKPFDM